MFWELRGNVRGCKKANAFQMLQRHLSKVTYTENSTYSHMSVENMTKSVSNGITYK